MTQLSVDDADALEALCSAVDTIALTEAYIDSNVSVPLAMQQFAAALERTFAKEDEKGGIRTASTR
jgi:hypothetical protein